MFGNDPYEHMRPFELNFLDDAEMMIQTQIRLLLERIFHLGEFLTPLIELFICQVELQEGLAEPQIPLNDYDRELLSELYAQWLDFYVDFFEQMREVHLDTTAEGRRIRYSLGMHVIKELGKINYLLHIGGLLLEDKNVQNLPPEAISKGYSVLFSLKEGTKDALWVNVCNTFDIASLYEEKDPKNPQGEALYQKIRTKMWETPIWKFTQAEVCIMLIFLTQQINDIPTCKPEVVREFRQTCELIFLRITAISIEAHEEDVLDAAEMHDPFPLQEGLFVANRNFEMFASNYMGTILYRFYYYDLLKRNGMSRETIPFEMLATRAKEWITDIAKKMPEDTFDELYVRATRDAYTFPGDEWWYRYKKPGERPEPGGYVQEIRPHMIKRFFSEKQVTPDTALNPTTLVGRLFIMYLVNEHIKIAIDRCQWLNVVVQAEGIKMSKYVLQEEEVPCLLQTLSSYWPYDAGKVWICDNIYEAIGVWFWLLAKRHNGILMDVDLREFARQVVAPAMPAQVRIGPTVPAQPVVRFEL